MEILRTRTSPEIRNLMLNLLPGTKPEKAMLHGILYEQTRAAGPSKCKYDSAN